MSSARKFIQESEFLDSLHGPFFPADVRQGQNVSAKLSVENEQFSHDLNVWRLSPLGVELLNDKDVEIHRGQKVSVTLNLGDQSSQFNGLIVDSIQNISGREILGIRLVVDPIPFSGGAERRKRKRWSTSNQFLPTGMAPNPAKYNDFIFFKIKDVSANGMQIITSLRNKFIVPGMKFESSISFPMISQVRANFTIKNIRISDESGGEHLSLGVEFSEKTTDLLDTIGQYLSQFSDVSKLSELHKDGLSPTTMTGSLNFSYVKTEDDYKEVLKLRYIAYKAEGKVSKNSTIEDMGDVYDTRSRIVIGKIGDKVVTTGRMTFCDFDQPLEHEEYIEWDATLPRREDSVEIMRVCTHPDFRGSDILVQMFRFMATASAQSKRKWIVLCSTEKYLNMYKKMGGQITGHDFELTKLNNSPHKLLVGPIQDSLLGKGLNPLFWNYIYGDLIQYLEDSKTLDFKPIDRLRIAIYRTLKPLSMFLFKYFHAPKKIEKARVSQLEVHQ